MSELKQDLKLLEFVTQYDAQQSTILLDCVRNLMHNPKSMKETATFINSRIANASSRDMGFAILRKLLPDCTQELLESNAKNWIVSALPKHQNEVITPSRLQFIAEVLQRFHANQEFHKAIVTNLLPKIVESCIWVHIKSPTAEHALDLLHNTMKYFPNTCITLKRKIEEYVNSFFDISCKITTTFAAAKCFHSLNQIGGAGPNGAVHIKNYEESFEKLCNTLTLLYNSMFEHINEFRKVTSIEDEAKVLKFKPLPTHFSTIDVYNILNRRMGTVVIIMIEMLQNEYNMKKTVKPVVLEVIQRGLDIHIHEDGTDLNVMFNQCIQQHQIKLMFLLKALIQSIQHQFMRHMTIKMLARYLSRVSECNCYLTNSSYKTGIYDVISFWLARSGEQIDSQTLEKLIEIIIHDITPSKDTLTLQSNLNEKSQSNRQSPRIQSTLIANCLGALNLLESLLNHIHFNIKKELCTQLYDVIVKTLMDICVNNFTSPYTSKNNRLQLFNVLIAVFNQHVHCIDINLSVNILHLAQQNDCKDLSLICAKGLSVIEKIVHPIQPSLRLSQKSIENDVENGTNSVEKNATVKILSNLLIQTDATLAEETDKECVETVVETNTAEHADDNDIFEIVSDHEVDAEDEADVSMLDQDGYPLPMKRRKAEDKNIICTFDISDDPLDSFVDEII